VCLFRAYRQAICFTDYVLRFCPQHRESGKPILLPIRKNNNGITDTYESSCNTILSKWDKSMFEHYRRRREGGMRMHLSHSAAIRRALRALR
jgi:hypothetical protein